jgi:ABC-type nitrate/sulfonate/bicarbonate transport system substrate-binding protein
MNRKSSPKAGNHLVFVFSLGLAFVLFLGSSVRAAEGLQKIRVGFPSLAFSYMPYYVAQEKGILKK